MSEIYTSVEMISEKVKTVETGTKKTKQKLFLHTK